MTTLRTHFTFRVDTWTPDGESIVEHVAGVEDYQVALATYRAACQRWPGIPITLRHGARVMIAFDALRLMNIEFLSRCCGRVSRMMSKSEEDSVSDGACL